MTGGGYQWGGPGVSCTYSISRSSQSSLAGVNPLLSQHTVSYLLQTDSAVRLGGALPHSQDQRKVCGGSDVLTAELFFFFFSPFFSSLPPREPSDEVHCCYVSVTCLSSVKALLSAAPQHTARDVGAET